MKIDDREARAALKRLAEASGDMRSAMRDIAAALEDAALDAFDRQRAPDGEPWARLSDSTKARRERRRTWPGRILQIEGARGGGPSPRVRGKPTSTRC